MSTPYHGKKPITEEDGDMAEDHLKATKKIKKMVAELISEKSEDHREAIKDRMKDKDLSPAIKKKSISYNKSHADKHDDEVDDIDHEQDKIDQSLKTLGALRTHSRRTYNQVRDQKVKLMYRKAKVA